MEVYKRETEEILKHFLNQEMGFPECIDALNAEFADVLTRLGGKELDSLRTLLMAYDDILTKEIARRANRELRIRGGTRPA